MRTPMALLWLGIFGISLICRAESLKTTAADHGVVVLKPMRVNGGAFDIHGTLKSGTELLRNAIVTYVAPGLKKQGLRENINLISINGKSIKGMPLSRFNELMQHELKAGETDTFIFTGKWGLFGQKKYTVVFANNKTHGPMQNDPIVSETK